MSSLISMQSGTPTTGSFSFPVQNGTNGALILSGGVVVDPVTNQAFVCESGSNLIQVVNLGPGVSNKLKNTQITEVLVPIPSLGWRNWWRSQGFRSAGDSDFHDGFAGVQIWVRVS